MARGGTGYIAGIVIRMGAEAEQLGKTIDDATSSASKLQKELQRTEQALKLDPGNANLAKDKMDILRESVESTRKKLDALKEAHKDAEAALARGDISTSEYRALNRELATTEANLKDLEKALKGVKWKEFGDKAEKAGQKLKDVGGKLQGYGSTMNRYVTLPLAALGTAAINAAADMEALEAQFEQTFGDETSRATNILTDLGDEFGMLPGRMKPALIQMTAFAKTAGMETPDALDMSARALRVAADSSAFYDRSLEDVTDSLQSFLKGNYANDAALGISATETTRNTKANELYGMSFKDLSEAQKQLTLLAMVEEGNELSGALGQAARESDGLINQMGNLKQSGYEAAAEFGENFLPVVIEIMKKVTDWTQKFSELDEDTQDLMIKLGLFAAAAGPALSVLGKFGSLAGGAVGSVGKLAGAIAAKGGLVAALGGPLGLIAIAGLAAVAIYKLGYEMDEGIDKTGKWKRDFEKLNTTMDGQRQGFRDNAKRAMELVETIDKLNAVEELSTEQKLQMKAAVKELETLYPDLDLAIDNNTGKLKDSTKIVKDYIREYLKLQLAESYADQFAENMKLREKAYENLAAAQERYNTAVDSFEKKRDDPNTDPLVLGNLEGAVAGAKANVAEAEAAVEQVFEAEKKLVESLDGINAEVDAMLGERTENYIAHSEDLIAEARKNHEEFYGVRRETEKVEKELNKNLNKNSKEREKILRDESKERKSLQKEIRKEIRDHANTIFDIEKESLVNSDITMWKTISNLQKQVEEYKNWRANLAEVTKRVPTDVAEYLKDLGPAAAGMIAEMTYASDEELQTFVDLVREMAGLAKDDFGSEFGKVENEARTATQKAAAAVRGERSHTRKAAEETGAEIPDGLVSGMKGRKQNVYNEGYSAGRSGVQGASDGAGGAYNVGVNIINGLAEGLRDRRWYSTDMARKAADSAIIEMNRVTKSRSPSERGREVGTNIIDGLALGIEGGIPQILAISGKAGEAALSALQRNISGLDWMSNPAEFNLPKTALSQRQVYVTGNQFVVREEADVEKIAVALDRMVKREERGLT